MAQRTKTEGCKKHGLQDITRRRRNRDGQFYGFENVCKICARGRLRDHRGTSEKLAFMGAKLFRTQCYSGHETLLKQPATVKDQDFWCSRCDGWVPCYSVLAA